MEVLANKLSQNAVEMMRTTLHGKKIRTSEHIWKSVGMLKRGIYQVSLLSLTLCHLLMDTYTNMTEEKMAEPGHQGHACNWEVVLFADNLNCKQQLPENYRSSTMYQSHGQHSWHDMENRQVQNNGPRDWGRFSYSDW